ncbi:hypothetical protein G3N95_36155 [Paraburkholderia sp. Tr-20389]|uniref:hypothetical protein n=1 Tax=Paraburkholderia sp. Tr-20389 TaxID=2703903 RepID=UPI0019817772|nr:hypothetical protein [Paraburkholderia sp. Tr-20389]MBN3758390.1 hypothetical protein [Paraburkholderia sp. Tr-20389]
MIPNRDDLVEALTYLCEVGVDLTVMPAGPFDWHLTLTPQEAIDYMTDPDGVVARHLGISIGELNTWRETNGTYLCHAITHQGKRCRRVIPGTYFLIYDPAHNPAKWAAFERLGHCCTQHGGRRNGGAS